MLAVPGSLRHSGPVHDPAMTDGVIRLRAWQPADAEWYADAVTGDETIQRYTSEPATLTADDVRQALTDLAERWNAPAFLICDATTGERLGNIALVHDDGIGHVSYWLAATARGRGAATRALRLVSRWAFARRGLQELRLWTHVDNVASRQVAERAGYHRDPARDGQKQIKGATWQTVAYILPAATAAPT